MLWSRSEGVYLSLYRSFHAKQVLEAVSKPQGGQPARAD